jgi:hypothetical protein
MMACLAIWRHGNAIIFYNASHSLRWS